MEIDSPEATNNNVQRMVSKTANDFLKRQCQMGKKKSAVKGEGVAAQFPGKLHDLMDYVEQEGLQHIISWTRGGRAFKVHEPKLFVDSILPMFFYQTKYQSFQRQIYMWHFKKIWIGRDKGSFFHPYFKRGEKYLCKKMSRDIAEQPKSLFQSENQLVWDVELPATTESDIIDSRKPKNTGFPGGHAINTVDHDLSEEGKTNALVDKAQSVLQKEHQLTLGLGFLRVPKIDDVDYCTKNEDFVLNADWIVMPTCSKPFSCECSKDFDRVFCGSLVDRTVEQKPYSTACVDRNSILSGHDRAFSLGDCTRIFDSGNQSQTVVFNLKENWAMPRPIEEMMQNVENFNPYDIFDILELGNSCTGDENDFNDPFVEQDEIVFNREQFVW